MSLTSAQPIIVENEKGLLIDFRITGASVDGAPQKPSLMMDFGTLAPLSRKVGVWAMESSLQVFSPTTKPVLNTLIPTGISDSR